MTERPLKQQRRLRVSDINVVDPDPHHCGTHHSDQQAKFGDTVTFEDGTKVSVSREGSSRPGSRTMKPWREESPSLT
jgi:hypothetical protein